MHALEDPVQQRPLELVPLYRVNGSQCETACVLGVGEHASRLALRSIDTVKRDEFKRPLLNWIFERMHDESTAHVLGYINSDIILLPGLAASIAAVRAQFDEFLVVTRRWNVD